MSQKEKYLNDSFFFLSLLIKKIKLVVGRGGRGGVYALALPFTESATYKVLDV